MVAASLLLAALAAPLALAKPSTPRGVSAARAHLYAPNKDGTWSCLTAPHVTIPHKLINDNHCHCPDGSDQPGTAACAHLRQHQLAIPGFYCHNKGWHPRYLPLNRVDDGVCDYDLCCDGSDEPKGKCPDKCAVLGKERLKEEAAARHAQAAGVEARRKLEAEAAKMVQELKAKKGGLEGEVKATEREVERLRGVLATVEEEERERVVQHTESANVLYDLATNKISALRTALKSAVETRDTAVERLQRAEEILRGLKETYNPNFNDEGVKAAVAGYENHLSTYPAPVGIDGTVHDLLEDDDAELQQAAEADGADRRKGPSEVEQLWGFTSYLPPTLQASITTWISAAKDFLVENGVLMRPETTSSSSSGEESAQLKKARESLSTAESVHNAAKKRLSDLETDIATTYGPNDVFRSLKNKCVSKDEAGYTYTLCFWGSATQKSIRDGSSVSLGDFSSFSVLDEAGIESARLAQQGIWQHIPTEATEGQAVGDVGGEEGGDGSDEVVLQYEGGLACWNGPRRSAKVRLVCRSEEGLLEVREAEKCVYEMVVGTGAVCREGSEKREGAREAGKTHDEL
ncbi:hypothetical protein BJ508DRAFT_418848 [Ascobolus immersus RN42]|uniref:Glucosidase 2 subunit beta n=1 Tax=Ascobolus immersus RN42 TaxID=1160509 RepID=A0A3N4HW62_ASCIM|nr:hypothetical protein BJ508DRAFT_418848 [Ascobolus immersus RN42]